MVKWFSPTFFNFSLNLAIRNSWSEPQSAPGLVFADYIELLHLWRKEYNPSDFSVGHLVMSMCRVFSCVVRRGFLLWPVCSLGKTWRSSIVSTRNRIGKGTWNLLRILWKAWSVCSDFDLPCEYLRVLPPAAAGTLWVIRILKGSDLLHNCQHEITAYVLKDSKNVFSWLHSDQISWGCC